MITTDPELQPIRRWSYGPEGCDRCGVKRNVLAIAHVQFVEPHVSRPGPGWWVMRTRTACIDQAACDARVDKAQDRRRQRGKLLVLAEPAAPAAPKGTCRWCGEKLTGKNAKARNYCYRDREGRDCDVQAANSRVWSAREAVQRRGDEACVDCDSPGPWEAEHDLALEDGGEHTMANLVRRCEPCHAAKTAREATARAARRASSHVAKPEPRPTDAPKRA